MSKRPRRNHTPAFKAKVAISASRTLTWRLSLTSSVKVSPSDMQSWLGKSGQRDKWSFCLTTARMAGDQERP